jgi:hypothetical protein
MNIGMYIYICIYKYNIYVCMCVCIMNSFVCVGMSLCLHVYEYYEVCRYERIYVVW